MRTFGDGFVNVLLPVHLAALGLRNVEIGAIATATLLGSAAPVLLHSAFSTRDIPVLTSYGMAVVS